MVHCRRAKGSTGSKIGRWIRHQRIKSRPLKILSPVSHSLTRAPGSLTIVTGPLHTYVPHCSVGTYFRAVPSSTVCCHISCLPILKSSRDTSQLVGSDFHTSNEFIMGDPVAEKYREIEILNI